MNFSQKFGVFQTRKNGKNGFKKTFVKFPQHSFGNFTQNFSKKII